MTATDLSGSPSSIHKPDLSYTDTDGERNIEHSSDFFDFFVIFNFCIDNTGHICYNKVKLWFLDSFRIGERRQFQKRGTKI